MFNMTGSPILANKSSNGRGQVLFTENVARFGFPLLLVAVHIPLGLVLYQSSILSTFYPAVLFAASLFYAWRTEVSLDRVANFCGYLIGAEVLWRMAGSAIFWEFGKYATGAIMIVALVRRKRFKVAWMPMLYCILLVPGAFITLFVAGLGEAKDQISFNLSGPFLLLTAATYFVNVRFSPAKIKRLLMICTLPIISIALTTLYYTATIENIKFDSESNFLTSGGFGPNQVSSILGMGVFLCFCIYLLFRNSFRDQIIVGALALLFTAQSLMTFSRGGMYNATGAALVVVLFMVAGRRREIGRLLPLIVLGTVFLLVVFPYLNEFTGGALLNRFEDTSATGRIDIVDGDFHIFENNPVFGVGVGQAKALREAYYGQAVASHTEFLRIFSEHGLFGVLGIVLLGVGFFFSIRDQRTTVGKAFTAGAVTWSCLFMMNAGMRLAAPAFLWGLSYAIVSVPLLRVQERDEK